MKRFAILIITALTLGSCVSTTKYNSMRAQALRLEGELASCTTRGETLTRQNDDLAQKSESLESRLGLLQSDYDILTSKYNALISEGSEASSQMLRQLEQNQRELEELRNLLRAREEAIDALRRNVANALLGFEGRGLTVTTREGKVYVSMDEKLLFRSGSFEIDPEGARAVRELSGVLAQNPDISIMVEGHTDDVPYRGSGQLLDNLDLSAKRATTVVRLILENKDIDPSRLTAAGRGEYLPVAEGSTPEARAQNRRTDIILSPNLDELFRIMDR